jgi:hypothetical protein
VSLRAFVLWFGLVGAPLAWTVQLIVGYGVEEADCSAAGARWNLDTSTWEAVVFSVAAAIAAASVVAALWSWRRAEHGGDARGRVAFMAHGGVLVGVLFLLLVLMTGSGVLSLNPCTR